jgi:CDP-diglyceride synthetase
MNIIILVIITLLSFAKINSLAIKQRNNKKYFDKDNKGTFHGKIVFTIYFLILCLLPLLFSGFDFNKCFETLKISFMIIVLFELFIAKNSKSWLFTSVLIFITIFSFTYGASDIKNTLIYISIAIAADILMYFYGIEVVNKIENEKIKLRYPTWISKNKTVLSVLLSLLTLVLIKIIFFIDISLLILITVTLSTAIGDAIFSIYKRCNKIDFFNLTLGPIGGLTDRLDGWIFVLLIMNIVDFIINVM